MPNKTKVKMLVKKLDKGDYTIPIHGKVRLHKMGNILRLQHLQHKNEQATVLRLDKDRYQIISTGEIRNYEHTTNRSQNLTSVRKSLVDMRAYLTTNVTDVSKCRWVTLTYRENMTDTNRLYEDFKEFMKNFRKWGKGKGHDNIQYIIACEPQQRGAWHIHAVFIFEGKAPYIPNHVPHIYDESLSQKQNYKRIVKHQDFDSPLFKMWKHGWVTVKSLKNVDNVGAYLSSYMTDICLDDEDISNLDLTDCEILEKEVLTESGKTKTKKFAKGARLHLYPTGFRIWRCSRGVQKPTFEDMRMHEAQKKVSIGVLTYESTIQLTAEDDSFSNIIVNQYYNVIRKNSQDNQSCKNIVNKSNQDKDKLTKKVKADELRKIREFNRKKIEESMTKYNQVNDSNSHTHNGNKVQRLVLVENNVRGFKIKVINEMWILPELQGKYSERADQLRSEYLFTQLRELDNNMIDNLQSEIEKHLDTKHWLKMSV